jgi:subtilisin family serine protease
MRARWAAVGVAAALVFGSAAPALAAPGPPDHPEWWFDTWHVQQLWSAGARGQGIVIGEIDTGVNAGLPELSGHVLSGKDFGYEGGNGQTDRDVDPFGHGTAMASLMVARAGAFGIEGMAPAAHVLPLAVPINGTTDDAGEDADSDLQDAIRYAADHGAKIISMSLGAPTDADANSPSCPDDVQRSVDYALSKGAIVVASGGNSGDKGSPIEEPGVCLGVVSVGAVNSGGSVAPWSSRHPYLTVAAPGVNVPTIGQYPDEAFSGDGTSQAAAITSAGLALIWSKYPKLTNSQVVARLLATVDDKHGTRDKASGYGRIDIHSAVTANVPADAPNPVYATVAPFLARDKESDARPPAPKIKSVGKLAAAPAGFAPTAPAGPFASGAGLAGVVIGVIGLFVVILLVVGALRRRRVPAARPVESGIG